MQARQTEQRNKTAGMYEVVSKRLQSRKGMECNRSRNNCKQSRQASLGKLSFCWRKYVEVSGNDTAMNCAVFISDRWTIKLTKVWS